MGVRVTLDAEGPDVTSSRVFIKGRPEARGRKQQEEGGGGRVRGRRRTNSGAMGGQAASQGAWGPLRAGKSR